MELYSLCREAAEIAGISPESIGVDSNNYVRKRDLVSSGKFDVSALTGYGDNDFILLKDVVKGSFLISASIDNSVFTRGNVQINNGQTGSNVFLEVDLNDYVTVRCNLNNPEDVFDGWYKDGMKMSGNKEYTFQAKDEVELTAKIFYMDINNSSLLFENSGGTMSVNVSSNTGFTIS